MTLARKTALWFGLLSTLGTVTNAVPQTASNALQKDNAEKLTKPTVDYEGTVSIKLPSLKQFVAQVYYSQADGHHLIRYDGPIPAFEKFGFIPLPFSSYKRLGTFTTLADMDKSTSSTIIHSDGNHALKTMDLPSFENCEVKFVDGKQVEGHTITHYHVDGCKAMTGHIYRGDLYANEHSVIVLAQGEEIKDKPGNRYTRWKFV